MDIPTLREKNFPGFDVLNILHTLVEKTKPKSIEECDFFGNNDTQEVSLHIKLKNGKTFIVTACKE